MKKVIILSFVAIALTLGACNSSSTKNEQANSTKDTAVFQAIDTTKLVKGAVFYQCEMHPEEISGKPGSCPKCGMDLEKIIKQ